MLPSSVKMPTGSVPDRSLMISYFHFVQDSPAATGAAHAQHSQHCCGARRRRKYENFSQRRTAEHTQSSWVGLKRTLHGLWAGERDGLSVANVKRERRPPWAWQPECAPHHQLRRFHCVPSVEVRTSALQTFLAIADPSGDSSEYGGSPAVASRDEVKMSIPLLSAAHESGEFGVETRRVLEERRMTDALIDRELGARDHFRRVLGSDEVRVLVLGPVGH